MKYDITDIRKLAEEIHIKCEKLKNDLSQENKKMTEIKPLNLYSKLELQDLKQQTLDYQDYILNELDKPENKGNNEFTIVCFKHCIYTWECLRQIDAVLNKEINDKIKRMNNR